MVVTPIMTTMITATSSAANKFHAWHLRNLNTRGELQVNSFIYSKKKKYNERVSDFIFRKRTPIQCTYSF